MLVVKDKAHDDYIFFNTPLTDIKDSVTVYL